MRSWRYLVDREKKAEAQGWTGLAFDDAAWKTTDPTIDTWSALGLHNYMGAVCYRATAKLAAAIVGRRTTSAPSVLAAKLLQSLLRAIGRPRSDSSEMGQSLQNSN